MRTPPEDLFFSLDCNCQIPDLGWDSNRTADICDAVFLLAKPPPSLVKNHAQRGAENIFHYQQSQISALHHIGTASDVFSDLIMALFQSYLTRCWLASPSLPKLHTDFGCLVVYDYPNERWGT